MSLWWAEMSVLHQSSVEQKPFCLLKVRNLMHGIGYKEANQMLVCQLRGEQQQEIITKPRLDRECRSSRFQRARPVHRMHNQGRQVQWRSRRVKRSSHVLEGLRCGEECTRARQNVPEITWLLGGCHHQPSDPVFLIAGLPCQFWNVGVCEC